MSEMNDWNAKIIDEFRANGGKVGGPLEGAPVLLLHHRGAKTGVNRVNPLVYRPEGDAWVIFASKAGADTNPDWFHNVVANPDAEIEIGTETVPVHARVAEGGERDRLYNGQKADMATFAEYEAKTSRVIPVVVLERR